MMTHRHETPPEEAEPLQPGPDNPEPADQADRDKEEKYTVREAVEGQAFSTTKGFRFAIVNRAGVVVAQTDSRAHADIFEEALQQDTKKERKLHRAA
jgi:hypothetical protein